MNKQWTLGIIAVLVIAIGAAVIVSQKNKQELMSQKSESNSMMEKEDAMMSGETKTPDSSMHDDNKDMAMDSSAKPGAYLNYSSETVRTQQDMGQKVVLFFHAPWCPFCKAADAALNEKLSQLPAGVTVLKTDYDSNTELKKKYGVTYQHTFVQIDNNGNLVTKWNGGDIDALKQNLK